jgi:hypothetical protein
MKYYYIYLIIFSVVFSECENNNKSYSEKYIEMETNTYIEIIDSVLAINLWNSDEHKDEIPVFILDDSIYSPKSIFYPYIFYPEYGPYFKVDLATRIFPLEKLSNPNKYIFLSSKDYHGTKYNSLDSIYNVVNSIIKKGQVFTGAWIMLSRICYNEDFTRGFFYFTYWKGTRWAGEYKISIERVKNKWEIYKIIRIWIA